jgi:hypothetical protein
VSSSFQIFLYLQTAAAFIVFVLSFLCVPILSKVTRGLFLSLKPLGKNEKGADNNACSPNDFLRKSTMTTLAQGLPYFEFYIVRRAEKHISR